MIGSGGGRAGMMRAGGDGRVVGLSRWLARQGRKEGGEGRCGAGRTAQLPEERHDLLLEDVVDVRAALRARVARQPGQPQLSLFPKLPQLALAP